jgi:hypothetical protein
MHTMMLRSASSVIGREKELKQEEEGGLSHGKESDGKSW